MYFNWASGKAEKCTLCYPRLESGQPTICSETCVGRIRYLSLVLYDSDRVEEVASAPDEKGLLAAQFSLFLDPHDPAVAEQARRDGIAEDWLEAAKRSPVYALAVEHRVALPLHPEYRTLPMVWYVPPLSPVMSMVEGEGSQADPRTGRGRAPARRRRPSRGARRSRALRPAQGDAGRRRGAEVSHVDFFLWVAFPYLSIAVFVVGHIVRYGHDQYGWTARSTQLLERRRLMVGSLLFHFGILAAIGGHLLGMLATVWGSAVERHAYRETVSPWFRGILALRPHESLMTQAPFLFQAHAVSAWLLLGIWPFTRLAHVWSAPLRHLGRAPIFCRSREPRASPLGEGS